MNSLLAFCISFLFLLPQHFSELRSQYALATKSKNNTEKFYDFVHKIASETPVVLAYKGSAVLLKSRFATNKEDRKEQFGLGVKMVEQAVNKDANNLEIRLVRLSIQEHTPKFLKYKGSIEDDKKVIFQGYSKQNSSLKEYIQRYVAQSKVFTEAEKSKFN